jgi:hypothetical protein
MSAAWIELWRGSHCINGMRLPADGVLRIGRALDNDLIVADAGIAPHHASLQLVGDAIQVSWILQTPGTPVTEARFRGAALDLNLPFEWPDSAEHGASATSDALELGGGWSLRWMGARAANNPAVLVREQPMVISAKAPVSRPLQPPTPRQQPQPQTDWADAAPVWKWLLILGALLACEYGFSHWLGLSQGEAPARGWIAGALSALGYLAVWAAAWMLVTKLFSQRTRFGLHLLIAGSALLVGSLFGGLMSLVSYALSWRSASTLALWGIAVLAFVCLWAHLRAATRVSTMNLTVAVASLAVGVGGFKLYWDASVSRDAGGASHVGTLLPGITPLRGNTDLDGLLVNAKALEAQLREAAAKPPPEGDATDSDDHELDE